MNKVKFNDEFKFVKKYFKMNLKYLKISSFLSVEDFRTKKGVLG